MEEKITEKITATAAETFRNLNRLRVLVESVRSLASEVNPGDAPAAPAEELPGMITEGIVSRLEELERNLAAIAGVVDNALAAATSAQDAADKAQSTAAAANTTANSALTTADTAKTTASSARTTAASASTAANGALTKVGAAQTAASEAQTLAEIVASAILAVHGGDRRLYLRGKFTDSSTETDWWWNMGGTKKSIAEFVDPETKAFSIPFGQFTSKEFRYMFSSNTGLEAITEWPFPVRPTTVQSLVDGCTGLTSLCLSGLDLSECTVFSNLALNCSGLTSVDVSGIQTGKVTSMTSMFNGCRSLTGIDVSSFDTRNVVTMNSMFSNCRSLTSLDLSSFDLGKVTTLGYFCANDVALLSVIPPRNTGNVSIFTAMFSCCGRLSGLDVSGFDTSNATKMDDMFRNVQNVEFDLRGWDTSKVTNMSWMFYGCTKLGRLLLGVLDLSSLTELDDMFYRCTSLTEVSGEIRGLKLGINLSACPLTNGSAMVFINGLADVTTAQTVTFSAATYATLTEEQIALATAKGWTVAQAE